MTPECDRDDVEQLIDHLSEAEDWQIEDWDFQVGRFEQATVKIEVEWDPVVPEDAQPANVLAAIEQLDDGDGVSTELVKDKIGMPAVVAETIQTLKQQGDIYEPTAGVVQVV